MADQLHLTSSGDGILLTSSPLSEIQALQFVRDETAGATCLFVGTTRNSFEGQKVVRLEYEAYEDLALKTLHSILIRCRSQFSSSPNSHSSSSSSFSSSSPSLTKLFISHRTGVVNVCEPSILVATSCPHRRLAFESCEWVLERVKEEVQIWKKEVYQRGMEEDGEVEGKEGGREGSKIEGNRREESSWKENFPVARGGR